MFRWLLVIAACLVAFDLASALRLPGSVSALLGFALVLATAINLLAVIRRSSLGVDTSLRRPSK